MKTSLLKAFFGLCALMPLSSFAIHYGHEVNDRINDLVNITGATAPDSSLPSCSKRYADLYKDGTLNITIGFGYWDNSPNEDVFDHYIANGLRFALVAPCAPGVNVCGFKRVGDVYSKTVKGPEGKPNKLTVSLIYGTLTKSNLDNTTKFKKQQDAQCEAATNNFFKATSGGSEVVMYIGHARDGGGPDFCPPVRDSHKKTNYSWYQKNRPGFKRLLTAMGESRAAGKPNQIVGLYSCYSNRHFNKGMTAKSPETGLVLTDVEITSQDAIKSLVTTIDAVAAKKCSQPFAEGLRLSPGVKTFRMFPASP